MKKERKREFLMLSGRLSVTVEIKWDSLVPELAKNGIDAVLEAKFGDFVSLTIETQTDGPSKKKLGREMWAQALATNVDVLHLSKREHFCLLNNHLNYLWQIAQLTETELLEKKRIGPKMVDNIISAFKNLGLPDLRTLNKELDVLAEAEAITNR